MKAFVTNNEGSKDYSTQMTFGSLVLSSTKEFHELTNETIQFDVENSNGNTLNVTPADFPLAPYVLLSTFGQPAVTADGTNKMSVVIPFSPAGNINLAAKGQIKLKFANLDATKVYGLNLLDEPLISETAYKYEQKQIALAETEQVFDVREHQLICFDRQNQLTDILIEYDNGRQCLYSPEELDAISRTIDPIQSVASAGTVKSNNQKYIVFPLMGALGVKAIRFRKVAGQIFNVYLRKEVR